MADKQQNNNKKSKEFPNDFVTYIKLIFLKFGYKYIIILI